MLFRHLRLLFGKGNIGQTHNKSFCNVTHPYLTGIDYTHLVRGNWNGMSLSHILIFTNHSAFCCPSAHSFLSAVCTACPHHCSAQFRMAFRQKDWCKHAEEAASEMSRPLQCTHSSSFLKSLKKMEKLAALHLCSKLTVAEG